MAYSQNSGVLEILGSRTGGGPSLVDVRLGGDSLFHAQLNLNDAGEIDRLAQMIHDRCPALSAEEIRPAILDAMNQTSTPDSSKAVEAIEETVPTLPDVVLGLNEAEATDQVITHLGALGWGEGDDESLRVYSHNGVLSHIVESESSQSAGQLQIVDASKSAIRERIPRACNTLAERNLKDGSALEPTRPTPWLIDAIRERRVFGGRIRPIAGIAQAPTFRRDGSILQNRGYDSASGLFYQSRQAYPLVSENPTRDHALASLFNLDYAFRDFPCYSAEDRSAFLALVLTLVGRERIDGCVPLFSITANVPGIGKGLLADVASLIATGNVVARRTFPHNHAEQQKVITSIVRNNPRVVLFDNLSVPLGGASLDALLTSRTWNDRILGLSESTGDLPVNSVFCATGNNISFVGDTARRVLPIRLHTNLQDPGSRSGFAQPDLRNWLRTEHPVLVTSAITILRAYIHAGCPVQPGGEWGGFEEWSKFIRGALVWAGQPDPLQTRASARQNDESLDQVAMLINGIREIDPNGVGVTTQTIEQALHSRPYDYPILANACIAICGDTFNSRRFGKALSLARGRNFQGQTIVGHDVSSVKRWSVRNVV